MTSKRTKNKILFLAPYPIDNAPSQRLKYEQYYRHFEESGFEITTSSFVSLYFWNFIYKEGNTVLKIMYTLSGYITRVADLFRLRKYDIIYIHLWATPIGPPIFEWLVRKIAKKVIFDIDDMVYLGHSSSANRMWLKLKGKAKMIYLMKKADHVIVSSPQLYEFANNLNSNVSDISSTVDTSRFVPLDSKPSNANTKLIIGWTGTHSTSNYLHLLDNVLLKLAKEFDFKLLVIGDEDFFIEGIQTETIPWRLETEVSDLQRIDIGLYPLPFDEWVYGKSGLKAITYMSIGISSVNTAVGTNLRVVEDGTTGFLVKTEEEWVEKIKLLAQDEQLRKSMGEAGRKLVEQKFSVNANKDLYTNVFHKTIGHTR